MYRKSSTPSEHKEKRFRQQWYWLAVKRLFQAFPGGSEDSELLMQVARVYPCSGSQIPEAAPDGSAGQTERAHTLQEGSEVPRAASKTLCRQANK